MNFIKATSFAALTIFAASSQAQSFYVEGQLSTNDADIKSKEYSGTAFGITATNLRFDPDYDNSTSLGVEVGKSLTENFRVGISYTRHDFDFKSAAIIGSITNGTTTFTGPVNITAADAADVGVTFGSEINVFQVRGYIDFPQDNGLTPYIGAGIGLADIEFAKDNETALSLAVGANYDLNENFYVGANFALTRVSGFTDGLDINYDDVDVTTAQIHVGYRF
jgi:opacity protein-like surface antigen